MVFYFFHFLFPVIDYPHSWYPSNINPAIIMGLVIVPYESNSQISIQFTNGQLQKIIAYPPMNDKPYIRQNSQKCDFGCGACVKKLTSQLPLVQLSSPRGLGRLRRHQPISAISAGSNNTNLLVPSGQFGTRLQGGKVPVTQ